MIRLHRIKAFILRHLYEIRATLDRKADLFFWPVVDLLTFGLLTVYIERLDIRPGLASVIVGGLIFWTLVFNIQRDVTVTLLEEAWSRNLFNLFSSPLKVSEVIIGTVFLSAVKALITTVLVLFLASEFFHFDILDLGPVALFYILNLFVFGWAFGYLTSSLILQFGMRLQILAWSLVAVIYPISGVFYPLSVLPAYLADLARLFPISYIFEGLRGIILYGQAPRSGELVFIAALNLVYFSLGIWLFLRGFKSAKNRGWFIHPS